MKIISKFKDYYDYLVGIYGEDPALGVYLPEQWLWQEISAYLGQLRSEQETSPPVPDKNKIENKGFDVKHSFRPKMKK
ncbi:hypothetical protein [Wielerella bovis]|uniref:hypothetical protein n=1 Tax=Wielerella bovis TaxID=2917790 RepID=UPI00201A0F26|nr:hypothetical protein [Wielerella bovis]ULJ60456.1 hypothetical protein MIS44_00770 [Wielerella bovis]